MHRRNKMWSELGSLLTILNLMFEIIAMLVAHTNTYFMNMYNVLVYIYAPIKLVHKPNLNNVTILLKKFSCPLFVTRLMYMSLHKDPDNILIEVTISVVA